MTAANLIFQEAIAAAKKAEAEFVAKNGEMAYCGFAWVEVYVDRANSKTAKELIAAGLKKDYNQKDRHFRHCKSLILNVFNALFVLLFLLNLRGCKQKRGSRTYALLLRMRGHLLL